MAGSLLEGHPPLPAPSSEPFAHPKRRTDKTVPSFGPDAPPSPPSTAPPAPPEKSPRRSTAESHSSPSNAQLITSIALRHPLVSKLPEQHRTLHGPCLFLRVAGLTAPHQFHHWDRSLTQSQTPTTHQPQSLPLDLTHHHLTLRHPVTANTDDRTPLEIQLSTPPASHSECQQVWYPQSPTTKIVSSTCSSNQQTSNDNVSPPYHHVHTWVAPSSTPAYPKSQIPKKMLWSPPAHPSRRPQRDFCILQTSHKVC
jgi:hypothetical protein